MNTREDKILNSLTGLQKTTAPDFFYTRLIGRMQNELPEKKSRLLLRPVILTISLSVVLVFNIVALTKLNHQPQTKKMQQSNETATIQSFANAYNLTAEPVYE
jgi:hypothetical protein